jgi:hypothetical protein
MGLEDGVIRVLPPGDPDSRRETTHHVSDRWLVAYAVAVGERRRRFVDVEHPGGVIAHPGFVNCLEWPLVEHGAPGIELTQTTLRRGLHARHTVEFYGTIRGDSRFTTVAELLHVEQRSASVHVVTQLQTYSERDPVATTQLHMVYPGVQLEGASRPRPESTAVHQSGTAPESLELVGTFYVDESNAVIYSECARIWNPIHTDIRVARAAGLRSTVLHGTETMARALTHIMQYLPGSPTELKAASCRFTAKVEPGEHLEVWASRPDQDSVAFEVRSSSGNTPISNGALLLLSSEAHQAAAESVAAQSLATNPAAAVPAAGRHLSGESIDAD